MKLNNREEPFTPICTTENVPLFVMYIKEELPEKHKSKLEAHLSHCDDCKMNLAYIKEILQFKHHLSIDEKTLLLKYLSDPLFYYFANNIRKKVLEDVKEIVKEAKAKINEVNEVNNTIDARVKDFGKAEKLPKKLHQQIPYSYLVLTTSIILFLSLGISIVLALSSKYPTLQSYSPFSNRTSSAVEERLPTNLGSELSINLAKTAENNRYQQLDTAIDEFLATKDRKHLEQAESIAKDIRLFYEDNYGVDLVNYYKTVPSLAIEPLSIHRKKLAELTSQATGDDYKQRLVDSQKLEAQLLSFGNLIEAYKIKALINKLHVQLHNDKEANFITEDGLTFSNKNNYLLLEADFLLWKAKRLCEVPDFTNAQDAFLKVIDLGNKLQINKLVTSAGTSLAFLHYNQNDDEKAFELAKNTLLSFTDYKNTQAITLLQLAGLASFNLHYQEIADLFFKEAIKNSEEMANPVFTARSYAFLALALSEKRNFSEANNFYSKAELETNKIKDETARLEALAWVTGYKAKLRLLENNYDQAIELYENKLSIMNKIHLVNNLEISQSHEGIALALLALDRKGKAQQHLAVAKNYENFAKANNEISNCLLALVPSDCKLKD
ncbi:MAG: zf-HC2 domain-containing protein [Blastocatellia bacterium]